MIVRVGGKGVSPLIITSNAWHASCMANGVFVSLFLSTFVFVDLWLIVVTSSDQHASYIAYGVFFIAMLELFDHNCVS